MMRKKVVLLGALAMCACSVTGAGQIPCADDSSCPADYPVCSGAAAGKLGTCAAGNAAAPSIEIVGVEGHSAADVLGNHATALVDATARAPTGVQAGSVTLTAGTKTYTAQASSGTSLFTFSVPTDDLVEGDFALKASFVAGDGTKVSSTKPFTLHVDDVAPVLTSSATLEQAQPGTLETFDVTASEPLATLSADVLSGSTVVGHATEISPATGNVHHLGFAVFSAMAAGTYTISVTATDVAGNATAAPLTKSFNVPLPPASNVSVDNANISIGDQAHLTVTFSNGTATLSDSNNDSFPAITSGQKITVAPQTTTVYTLTVSNAAGASAVSTVTIFVGQSVATSLTPPASPSNPGDAVTLKANVQSNATQAFVVPGNFAVPADNADHLISVSPTVTTTYTLVATNSAGQEFRKTATVTVTQPVITSFSGPDAVTSGTAPTLTATFTPATPKLVSVDHGCTGGPATFTCTPITQATTYTLTVMLGTASVTATQTVQAAPDPALQLAFGASPPILPFASSTSTALTASFCGASSLCSGAYSVGGGSSMTPISSGASTSPLSQPVTTDYVLTVTNAAGKTQSAEITVPVFGAPFATGTMNSARQGAAVAMLPDGRIFVAGGSTNNSAATALDTAEIFDPASGAWTAVSCNCVSSCGGTSKTLSSARFQATATPLQNGGVLVAGGLDTTATALASVDVYDPSNDCFRANSHPLALSTGRAGHSATSYNGKTNVIVIGGGSTTCEVFTQGTQINNGTFALCTGTGATKDMQVARTNHVAASLSGGRYVLLAGGATNDKSADIYDLSSNGANGFTRLSATTMQLARTSATATVLASGKVLVAGGNSSTAELFTFTPSPVGGATALTGNNMSGSRTGHVAIPLNGGGVLLAGGSSSTTVDAYDPTTNQFGASFSLSTARSYSFGFPLLLGGRALVGGGTTTATAADLIVP